MGISHRSAKTYANSPEAAAEQRRRAFEQRLRTAYVGAMRSWIEQTHKGVTSNWGDKPKPEYDGGVSTGGRRHRSVWEGLAKFLVDNDCFDPELFITANCVDAARPPDPRRLSNVEAIKCYRRYIAEAPTMLRCALASQATAFKVEQLRQATMSPNEPKETLWRNILRAPVVNMSPLFRYCIAVHEGLDDIAAHFEPFAVKQYMVNPNGYKEVWQSVLPPAFVARCNVLQAELKVGYG